MKKSKLSVVMAAMVLVFTNALAQEPEVNQALLDASKAQQEALIESLRDMVEIESGSDDIEGLERMARYTEESLRALGAETQRITATNDVPPGLVKGVFKGSGTLKVALIAHMDTVYQPGILELEPWRRDGNRIYGPGIADDKGGIAVILHSLAILQDAGWDDYDTLTVQFNADEEIGSVGSGAIITELGSENDVVLSYEPSPSKEVAGAEGVLLGTAGTASLSLVVHGRAAHAGAAHEEGRNALIELAHQLVQTRDIANSVPGSQLNWTSAQSGTARNQIPGLAEAGADVRITQKGAAEALLEAVRTQTEKNLLIPDTYTAAELEVLRPMFEADERGRALAELAESIYAELGEGKLGQENARLMPTEGVVRRSLLLIPGTTGGTDAGFAASSGKAAVLEGLGLAGWGYHASHEHIEVDSIVPRLYLTTRMLEILGRNYSEAE
ncbi:glutamate carboxypeptidase [Halomonas halocynthiae]|uniref:glutamate carboxypeptidase n=1 Tax=Halomonas halocynthiae TaxID=176290 RepID=UPI000426B42F|nr:glutamate carboxypeptidase [Halomonas halocynthiae]